MCLLTLARARRRAVAPAAVEAPQRATQRDIAAALLAVRACGARSASATGAWRAVRVQHAARRHSALFRARPCRHRTCCCAALRRPCQRARRTPGGSSGLDAAGLACVARNTAASTEGARQQQQRLVVGPCPRCSNKTTAAARATRGSSLPGELDAGRMAAEGVVLCDSLPSIPAFSRRCARAPRCVLGWLLLTTARTCARACTNRHRRRKAARSPLQVSSRAAPLAPLAASVQAKPTRGGGDLAAHRRAGRRGTRVGRWRAPPVELWCQRVW